MHRYRVKGAQKPVGQSGGFDWNGGIVAFENRNVELLAQCAQDITFCHVTQIDQNTAKLVFAFLLQRKRIFQILFGKQSTLLQHLAEQLSLAGDSLHQYSRIITWEGSSFFTVN